MQRSPRIAMRFFSPSGKEWRNLLLMENKAFNSTAEGQKAMAAKAGSDSVVLLTNAKVRQMGGDGWDPKSLASMLSGASQGTRDAIFADIITEYNALCAARDAKASAS